MLQAHNEPAFRGELIHESETRSRNLFTSTLLGVHHPDRARDILDVEWTVSRRDLRVLERGWIEWERVEVGVKRFNAACEIGCVQDVAAVGECADRQHCVDRSGGGNPDDCRIGIDGWIPGGYRPVDA